MENIDETQAQAANNIHSVCVSACVHLWLNSNSMSIICGSIIEHVTDSVALNSNHHNSCYICTQIGNKICVA